MREQALNTLRASRERSAPGDAGSQRDQPTAVGQSWGDSPLGAIWGQRLSVCGPHDASPLHWQDWQVQQESGSSLSPGQGVHWAGAEGMLPSPGTILQALPGVSCPERESC